MNPTRGRDKSRNSKVECKRKEEYVDGQIKILAQQFYMGNEEYYYKYRLEDIYEVTAKSVGYTFSASRRRIKLVSSGKAGAPELGAESATSKQSWGGRWTADNKKQDA